MKKFTIALAAALLLGLSACGGGGVRPASECSALIANYMKEQTKLGTMPADTNAQIAVYDKQVKVANAALDKVKAAGCTTS